MNAYSKALTLVMSERKVSLLGALMVAVGPVSLALFTPAMPEIVHVFGSTQSTVKLTLSMYFAGFALAQLVCGPLSDGYGRKPIIMAFMAIYLAASVMALFAPTIDWLIAARFLQGIGGAVGVAISRAIVRDLFTNESSARIMNLIGLILGIGPAFAPSLGGLTMQFYGWQSIFVLMVLMGITVIVVMHYFLVETVARDLSRIRPAALGRSYLQLLGSGYFISSAMVLAGSIGAFYTLAVVLPFIMMERVGLSPTAFGISMLAQSGSFFLGSLVVRRTMRIYGGLAIMPFGLTAIAIASVAFAVILRISEPTVLTVMGPVAVYAFGAAFLMPSMSTASLAPFPHIAGAAAALGGFMQMGGGLVGGLLSGLFTDPVTALATVVPGLGFIAIGCWLWWRSLPEPPMAGIVLNRAPEDGAVPPAE